MQTRTVTSCLRLLLVVALVSVALAEDISILGSLPPGRVGDVAFVSKALPSNVHVYASVPLFSDRDVNALEALHETDLADAISRVMAIPSPNPTLPATMAGGADIFVNPPKVVMLLAQEEGVLARNENGKGLRNFPLLSKFLSHQSELEVRFHHATSASLMASLMTGVAPSSHGLLDSSMSLLSASLADVVAQKRQALGAVTSIATDPAALTAISVSSILRKVLPATIMPRMPSLDEARTYLSARFPQEMGALSTEDPAAQDWLPVLTMLLQQTVSRSCYSQLFTAALSNLDSVPMAAVQLMDVALTTLLAEMGTSAPASHAAPIMVLVSLPSIAPFPLSSLPLAQADATETGAICQLPVGTTLTLDGSRAFLSLSQQSADLAEFEKGRLASCLAAALSNEDNGLLPAGWMAVDSAEAAQQLGGRRLFDDLGDFVPGGDNPTESDVAYFQITLWTSIALALAVAAFVNFTHNMDTGAEKLLEA